MEFSERLVQVRKARGLSQENLAEQIGVSRQAVSKWETGEALPDYTKLVALADVLEVGMDDLCGRAGQTGPHTELPGSAPLPAKKSSPLRVIAALMLALILLGGAFWAGTVVQERRAAAEAPSLPQEISLPDTVTADGVSFNTLGNVLSCSFVPSVAGEGYTYQVSFLSSSGSEQIFDAAFGGGSCFCRTSLKSGSGYTVTAIISNGQETRLALLATDLTFSGGSASWNPAS